jgi:spermidine/putrescine transport system ATP-binding protein
MAGGAVQLVDLHKTFGETTAVDHLDLEIRPGEFFSLLGPSGCGKTSTLRLIAGFERPTSGKILIDGKDMAETPPHQRPVNTVFQSYALFPHLTVGDNVAFGLKYHDLSKQETSEQVGRALDLVRLAGFEKRKPTQLSGGQQQRVALARSLVLNPSVLLLDEPLGALDAKLRKALQIELKALQENVGVTFIYVTHDQEEALTMSDRLAVMSAGRVEQVGTPSDVYEQPASAYVADFLGLSNLMPAEAIGPSATGGCRVRIGSYELVAGTGAVGSTGDVTVCIRPERILLGSTGNGYNELPGLVDRVVYMGSMLQVLIEVEGIGSIQAVVPNQGQDSLNRGEVISVVMPEEALRVLVPKASHIASETAEEPVPFRLPS